MSRIIIHEEKAPMEIKIGNESKHICMCGLTKNKPFCDGSHRKTKDEEKGKLYHYENEKRTTVF